LDGLTVSAAAMSLSPRRFQLFLILESVLVYLARCGGEDCGLQLIPTGPAGGEDDVSAFVGEAVEPRHAVAVLTASEGSKRHLLLQELADDRALGHVVTFGVQYARSGSSLRVFRHRYPTEVYGGKWTRGAIQKWLMQVGYPLVNRMSNQFASAKYLSESLFGVVLIVKPLGEQTDQLVEALEPFAKKYSDRLKFSFFTRAPSTQQLCDTFGIWSNDELLILEEPTYVRKRSHSHVPGPPKYRLEGVTPRSVEDFFADYDAKALPRYLQASVPRKVALQTTFDFAGGLRELSSWDFAETVADPDWAVLVEFVSTNCAQCDEFKAAFEEVARRVQVAAKKAPSSSPWRRVLVARMDQTANEHTETVKGTPWMKFWPRGRRKKPIDVELRSVDLISDFIDEQLSEEMSAEL